MYISTPNQSLPQWGFGHLLITRFPGYSLVSYNVDAAVIIRYGMDFLSKHTAMIVGIRF